MIKSLIFGLAFSATVAGITAIVIGEISDDLSSSIFGIISTTFYVGLLREMTISKPREVTHERTD